MDVKAGLFGCPKPNGGAKTSLRFSYSIPKEELSVIKEN